MKTLSKSFGVALFAMAAALLVVGSVGVGAQAGSPVLEARKGGKKHLIAPVPGGTSLPAPVEFARHKKHLAPKTEAGQPV